MNGNKTVEADFTAIPGSLSVSPSTGLSGSGAQGGPFSPSSQSYTLQNTGGSAINWSASRTQSWVNLSSGGGSLTAGASTTVVVSINSGANSLSAGSYSDTVSFTNTTNGVGNTSRLVALTVQSSVYGNIASLAAVTASSENSSTNQLAIKAVDGVIDGYPGDYTKEWATSGGRAGSWLQLNWSVSYTVDRVILYDRPNLNDQILSATLSFSDGSTLTVGPLNNAGAGTEYTFSPKVITSMRMTANTVSGGTQNVGLAEIQVYGTPSTSTQYSLTVNVSPSGAGSVSKNPNKSTYLEGEQVTLTAAANTGYAFSNWSGDASGTQNSIVITMNGNKTVEADFAAIPGSLSVSPSTGLSGSGAQGGPFSPSSQTYTLQNTGGSAINWSASNTQSWVSLSSGGGSLTAGASTTVVVSINSGANSLGAGSYSDTVSFTNTTNGAGNTSRSVALTVQTVIPGTLSVSPSTGLSGSGAQGGPFSPSSQTYTLQNTGGSAINWSASKTQSWVSLSSTGGSLSAGASTTVVVSINSGANSLSAGSYSDTVSFTNTTNGAGNTSRLVALTVQSSVYGNIASLAAVTASSENSSTNQLAIKAVDGVIDGYPGDYTKEWATSGGRAGSWLQLTGLFLTQWTR